MCDTHALRRLAAAHGIELEWHDIRGQPHEPSEATLRALLQAMHVSARDDSEAQRALHEHDSTLWRQLLPSTVALREQASSPEVVLRLPDQWDADNLAWRLREESGEEQGAPFVVHALKEAACAHLDGRRFVARRLVLRAKLRAGYHRLQLLRGRHTLAEALLIVAPQSCYAPHAVQGEGRTWGPAVQLYAVRSERNWGMGDFTDLQLLLEQWAQRGAGIVGLNPLHALFLQNPDQASPYSASSRLFLNPLYLDPERVDGFRECERARRLVGSAEFQTRLRELRASELVDYPAVTAAKMPVLEALYASFRQNQLPAGTARAREFRAFQANAGLGLQRHALFEALHEHFVRLDPSTWGWPAWPVPYRDPGSAEVGRFAEANGERIEFFQWLQWQADSQLARCGLRSLELHFGVGLYGDLAVSADRGGSEVWSRQDLYALEAGVGAPPDDFNLTGQNWGLPPLIPARLAQARFAPVIDALRANMRHNGALRIDHVMGLARLFWIPAGAGPAEGTYVRYPLKELLAIVALESQRNRCMVIGEDLGTVPDEVRHALCARRALSYRVLYFERYPSGEFKAPEDYPAQALVTATTHDLPTLCGFWEGRDLAVRNALNLFPSDDVRQRQTVERSLDRARLLLALEREGLLPSGVTPDPASVPAMTPELVRSIQAYLARTPCQVLTIQLEDVLSMVDQANLPGGTALRPNWRHKLTLDLERWPQDERFVELCEAIRRTRPPRASGQTTAKVSPHRTARIPLATYRLQLNQHFGFGAATAIVPYLAELGVSHVYCSPYLRARPGSSHGYDIIDHSALNPEIGRGEDFDRFVAALREHGMGQLLDLVPNHMGVMGADNPWWMDVLENGRSSVYADFFDIDWEPLNPALHGKLLVPVLGDHYGVVLERGELRLQFEREHGCFSVFYYEHRFPIDPQVYPRVLERAARALPVQEPDDIVRAEFQSLITAFSHLPGHDQQEPPLKSERNRDKELHKRRLAALCGAHSALARALDAALHALNGTPGEPRSFDALDELLDAQSYRLAFWRVASDEINYRRFLDINDLAALRMENEAVFEATHRLLFELVAAGKVDGVRIDHLDGLYDPSDYLQRLQDRFALCVGEARSGNDDRAALPLYVVIEKITAGHERTLPSWPVHGTTGYRFANVLNGLFVEPSARARMDRTYRGFVHGVPEYDEVVYESKRLILRTALAGELSVLTHQLARIGQADRRTRDFTLNDVRRALTEVIACFPVYRTYISEKVGKQDRRFVEWAVARAKRCSRAADTSIFDFLRSVLLGEIERPASEVAQQARVFVGKLQQFTGPVSAKGIEDTAFYRYVRLASLNEVGGDPAHFGSSLSAFHSASLDRSKHWPDTMLATSTHDTKRSEDVRLRIDALSEMPAVWRLNLRHWQRVNRSRKRRVEDTLAPSANEEYLLYQTLVGTWPLEPLDETALAAYCGRIQDYMLKAVREAKVHSSWINVNAEYERAVTDFVQSLLARLNDNLFLDAFLPLQRRISRLAMLHGLSHTAIKLASPGVPDLFQGSELWDLSLVDPDNRRPVDYDRRRALLAEVSARCRDSVENLRRWLRSILSSPEDGRCKLYVTHRGLHLRRARAELFRRGEYLALRGEGARAQQLVCFARRDPQAAVIVAAPRLLGSLLENSEAPPLGDKVWGETWIPVPWLAPQARLRNVLAGGEVRVHSHETGPRLLACEFLQHFPVALMELSME